MPIKTTFYDPFEFSLENILHRLKGKLGNGKIKPFKDRQTLEESILFIEELIRGNSSSSSNKLDQENDIELMLFESDQMVLFRIISIYLSLYHSYEVDKGLKSVIKSISDKTISNEAFAVGVENILNTYLSLIIEDDDVTRQHAIKDWIKNSKEINLRKFSESEKLIVLSSDIQSEIVSFISTYGNGNVSSSFDNWLNTGYSRSTIDLRMALITFVRIISYVDYYLNEQKGKSKLRFSECIQNHLKFNSKTSTISSISKLLRYDINNPMNELNLGSSSDTVYQSFIEKIKIYQV